MTKSKYLGRPTTFDESVINGALEYLENYKEHGDSVPSVVGLCRVIKRSKSIVYDWAKEPEKAIFSDILCQISEAQEQSLINGGLSNQYNPAITKMMLAKHGYSDSQQIKQETTHKLDKPLAERLTSGSKR